MSKRFFGPPVGSSRNFLTFRTATKLGRGLRKSSAPYKVKPSTITHTLKPSCVGKVGSAIKKMYPLSEEKQVIAAELIKFLTESKSNNSLPTPDIVYMVFNRLKKRFSVVTHIMGSGSKQYTKKRDFVSGTVERVYRDIIGKNGIVNRKL